MFSYNRGEKISFSSVVVLVGEVQRFQCNVRGVSSWRLCSGSPVTQVRSQPFTTLILFLKPPPDNQMGRITAHAVFLGFLGLQLLKTLNNLQTRPGKILISVICCVKGNPWQVFSPWRWFFVSQAASPLLGHPFQSRADKCGIIWLLSPAAADVEHYKHLPSIKFFCLFLSLVKHLSSHLELLFTATSLPLTSSTIYGIWSIITLISLKSPVLKDARVFTNLISTARVFYHNSKQFGWLRLSCRSISSQCLCLMKVTLFFCVS